MFNSFFSGGGGIECHDSENNKKYIYDFILLIHTIK